MLRLAKGDTLDIDLVADKGSSIEFVVKKSGKSIFSKRYRGGTIGIDIDEGVYTYQVNLITKNKVIMWEPKYLIITQ